MSRAFEGLANAPIGRCVAFILADSEPKWDKRDFQGGPRGVPGVGGAWLGAGQQGRKMHGFELENRNFR